MIVTFAILSVLATVAAIVWEIIQARRKGGPTVTMCPLCGSGQLVPNEQLEKLTVPYGPPCSFLCNEERCLVCKERGDFLGLNDARIEAALAKAAQQSVALMIDDLAGMGISMAYIERAMDLPQRTLSGWRDGDCPPAGLALLRIVRTHPWIVKAADAGFHQRAR